MARRSETPEACSDWSAIGSTPLISASLGTCPPAAPVDKYQPSTPQAGPHSGHKSAFSLSRFEEKQGAKRPTLNPPAEGVGGLGGLLIFSSLLFSGHAFVTLTA